MRKIGLKVLVLCLIMLFASSAAYAQAGHGKLQHNNCKSNEQHTKVKQKEHKQPKKGNKKPAYAAVTGITVSKTTASIGIGQWIRLDAAVQPANATDKKFYWFSDKPWVACVNPSGKVTGITAGTAKIYAATRDGFKTDFCTVTVSRTPVVDEDEDEDESDEITSIAIVKTGSYIAVREGYKRHLDVQIEPAEAQDNDLTWSTSDEDIVTVDSAGNITGVDEGTATITVTSEDGTESDSCSVKVIPVDEWERVTGVELNLEKISIPVGFTDSLRYEINPSDASDKGVRWISNNPDVATVTPYGTIEAKRRGTAVITVTSVDGVKKDTCTVTVVAAPKEPDRGILLNKTAITLEEGQTDYPAVIFYSADEDDYTLTWSSSNTHVATVGHNGKVTAKEPGTAVITVKTSNGWSASYRVTVVS